MKPAQLKRMNVVTMFPDRRVSNIDIELATLLRRLLVRGKSISVWWGTASISSSASYRAASNSQSTSGTRRNGVQRERRRSTVTVGMSSAYKKRIGKKRERSRLL